MVCAGNVVAGRLAWSLVVLALDRSCCTYVPVKNNVRNTRLVVMATEELLGDVGKSTGRQQVFVVEGRRRTKKCGHGRPTVDEICSH